MSAAAVAENVSLDAILADPTAYEGRELRIHGFLQIEYEGQSLWATEDDFHAQRYGRAAWLGIRFHPEILDDHRNGRRAYVTGILRYASDPRYSSHGPHEMWPVEITDFQWALYNQNGELCVEATTDISQAESGVTLLLTGDGNLDDVQEIFE